MPTPEVARIVVRGWTYVRRRSDSFTQARAMLSNALASTAWPSAQVGFTITPGGFIRAVLPGDYRGARGWRSTTSLSRVVSPRLAPVGPESSPTDPNPRFRTTIRSIHDV